MGGASVSRIEGFKKVKNMRRHSARDPKRLARAGSHVQAHTCGADAGLAKHARRAAGVGRVSEEE
eukprot:1729092-Rhodomonas_salina.1